MLGLMPFLVAEGLFTLLDWGQPSYGDDPFVGFRAVRPLFVVSEDGTRYEIAKSRQAYFRPESFARQKPSDEFRIFCLGGSTVQGRPFAVETSFTTWLELGLEAGEPERQWEVVNCGGISYASYRLVPILEEVLEYEPDLIVIYTGHNEFLEDRTYAQIKQMPEVVARPYEMLVKTRTYTLLREGYVRLRGRSDEAPEERPVLATDVDAMLDYRDGLESYHWDEKWRADVIEHFRYNLRRMVQIARQAGVPLVLMNPVSNLRDCPPFKSEHRAGLTPEELKAWERLVDKGRECQKSNAYEAMLTSQEALKIDDQHAGLHYLLAQCYDALEMADEARRSYLQAKELDVCPLRILEPMNRAVVEAAHQTGTPLVDVRRLYEARSELGMPGGYWLVDPVHPSIPGHPSIANALAEEIARQGFFQPRPDWPQTRDVRFREHLASLDDFYFAKGEERLARVRRWTQGKATGVRSRRSRE